MAGLKVTAHSAMRARDISRPRESHLAEAALDDYLDAASDGPGADGDRPSGSGDAKAGSGERGGGPRRRRS